MARREKKKHGAPPSANRSVLLSQRLPGGAGLWRWLALAACLWLVLALLYPGAVFKGEVFGSSDAANSDSFTLAGDRSLAAGHYPLWNPYLFAGMPSFGSLAYARFLYPPSLLLDTAQRHLGFPPLTWMIAHLLFGGLGMAWLLSRWRLPLAVLLFGGTAWLLLPKVVAWGVHGHGSKLGAAMYLPWIIGWAWRVLDGGDRRTLARAVAMTGLLLGLQLLRGHVQISYYTLLAVGWLVVWNIFWPLDGPDAAARATRLRRAGLVAGGLAIGFLIGAMLLVPVHGYAGISIRGQDTAGGGGVGLDYATGWSLAPAETPTLVLPGAAGFGKATYLGHMPFTDYPNYLGLLLLVLAAAAWRRGARSLVAALGVMTLLVIFVSWGNLGFGFYELLYRLLPFFNKFRIPSMILILSGFAAVLLAARGLAAWRDGDWPLGRPALLPGVLAILGLVLLLGGGASLLQAAHRASLESLAAAAGRPAVPVLLDEAWLLHRASLVRIGLVLLAAAGAFWFSTRHEAFRRLGLAWVVLGLVAADLSAVDRLIVHPERGLLEVARDGQGGARLVAATRPGHKPARKAGAGAGEGPAASALVAAVGHDRVWPLGSHGQRNTWMVDGVRSLGGYHPAKLASYEQIRKRLYAQEPAGRLAAWLGATVVAFDQPFQPGDLEFLAQVGAELAPEPLHGGRPAFYRNLSALPRARLVSRWRPVSALPAGDALEPFLDGIQAGTVPIDGIVTLDREPVPAPQATATPLAPPVFALDGMDEVVLETSAPVPALLLLADMNAPGWRVEVDGERRPLLTADLVLRAVALEAGSHTVRFHYRDPSVRTGLMLSLGGFLLVGALLLVPVPRRPAAATHGGEDV